MKKILTYVLLCCPLLAFFSCEMKLDPYSESVNRLDFVYERGQWTEPDADSVVNYTFVYLPADVKQDTVWLKLETIGFVTDYDRSVSLEQVPTSGLQAEAGKHYVAFDDPALTAGYVIVAGQTGVRIPVVLKRDDPALREHAVRLKIAVRENEYFKTGTLSRQTKVIVFSDKLVPLKYWDTNAEGYFGKYGEEKHRFMIQVTTSMEVLINDDFFEKLVGDAGSMDLGLLTYWSGFFKEKLKAENALRAQRGEGPLREKPLPGEDEGKIVSFERGM